MKATRIKRVKAPSTKRVKAPSTNIQHPEKLQAAKFKQRDRQAQLRRIVSDLDFMGIYLRAVALEVRQLSQKGTK